MNFDEFEKKLQSRPMRAIPREWRNEIVLGTTRKEIAAPWWQQWLWPCPQAWAGLAAVWLIILGANALANRGSVTAPAPRIALSRKELLALKQQQLALAQLVGLTEPADVPPPAIFSPRSERPKIWFNA